MSRRLALVLTSFLAVTVALLSFAPTLAQTEAPTAPATESASALPAACGNTDGMIKDIAAKIKADPSKKVKIGFLFVGLVDDFGYNYATNQGRLCLEAVYPGSTVYAENVPETAEAERVIENMIKNQGATRIWLKA